MSLRIVELTIPSSAERLLLKIIGRFADLHMLSKNTVEGEKIVFRFLVDSLIRQKLIDSVQKGLEEEVDWRLTVTPVEAVVPHPEPSEELTEMARKKLHRVSREELYNNVAHGSELTPNSVIMIFLATLVAAIGMMENNVAVIIGAMVISPLLGPSQAFALGTAMGDRKLMFRALKTSGFMFGFAILLSVVLGIFWPNSLMSKEILLRTDVNFAAVALALASGAAGALSLTAGLPSTLVGVMIAVALLPPAVVIGIMLGANNFNLALGATMLLAVNIIAVSLTAQLIFWLKGIKPRSWLQDESKGAKQSMYVTLAVWGVLLTLFMSMIALRDSFL
jgi:uncharacterized hydrophobic protein (TIGR00341 family)